MTTRRSFKASKTRRESSPRHCPRHRGLLTPDHHTPGVPRARYPMPGSVAQVRRRRDGIAPFREGLVCSSRVCPRNVNASSLADHKATMSPRMVRRSGNVPDDTQHDVSRRDAGRALRTCKSCGPGLAQHPGRETSSSARLRWPGKCPVSCQGQPPIGKDAASFGKIFRTTWQRMPPEAHGLPDGPAESRPSTAAADCS